MAIYKGDTRCHGKVGIGAVNPSAVRQATLSSDIPQEFEAGLSWALADENVLYFSIFEAEKLVGQTYLHDIDHQTQEALVGYHLLWPELRGRGIGTQALRMLIDFVLDNMQLTRLIIITGTENIPSRRMAETCGFVDVGPAREGPHLVVYEWRKTDDSA